MSATKTVVENKLVPIEGKEETGMPTVTFTAQTATELFNEFKGQVIGAQVGVVGVLRHFLQSSGKADAKEVGRALNGMVENTRVKDGDKWKDGEDTALARKFASMAKSIYGAVRFGNMSIAEVENATNSQKLYDNARNALASLKIDWQGTPTANKEAKAANRAQRAVIDELAEEEGIADPLLLTAEQFQALKAKAAERLKEKQAQAKLVEMEKKAEKLAAELVKAYGFDDAEHVLKRALEIMVNKMIGAAS